MRSRLAYLHWKAIGVLAVIGVITTVLLSRADNAGQKALAETRQALRQQGFKTDLTDFDFSTSPELRAREAILKATVQNRNQRKEPFVDFPNLMEAVGINSAVVVWKLDSLKKQYRSGPDNSDELGWEEFREAINANQLQMDAAGLAIMSGPIRFNLDASSGNAMLLPHLAMLKNLMQTFGSRAVFDLHDGNLDSAWTNAMVVTRLVTAWEPEPVEISQLVRFANTSLAFDTVWQALQTNGWSEEQLARLQAEWESVNFFTNLSETAAFKLASDEAYFKQDRQGLFSSRPTITEFISEGLQFPQLIWYRLNESWNRANYEKHGRDDDEKALLLFNRDRELQLRNAVQVPTWSAMRQLPGAINAPQFHSKYRSRLQAMLNVRALNLAFQREGSSLLGRAAKAETQRRLIITAIALERYHGRHGAYPSTLSALAPGFLKNPLVDFMDGQPLRYRLTNDGHVVLYSVGLDCVDDGGQMVSAEGWPRMPAFRADGSGASPKGDIVWPLPATSAAVQDLRRHESRTEELQQFREQQRVSDEDWKRSPLRQSRVNQILATNWLPVLGDAFFGGRPAAEYLRNAASTSNRLSLAELMTPRQVLTCNEPEELTFEFPVSYDAITNHGFFLLVDADIDPRTGYLADSGAMVQERRRAPNGNCLLVWHTIYDPPGQHALQVELTWYDAHGAETWCRGPAIAVVTSNLCQFSFDSSTYNVELGATFHARLPEANGLYAIECLTTNGQHLATLTGSTTHGEFNTNWNLVDDHGHRLGGETFNSTVHITLPDSGRSQTLKGP